jgi:uncharacterized protein YkwD
MRPWIVSILIALACMPPARADIAGRVLELVNAARAESRRCGRVRLPPAPPVRASAALGAAARAHARDMARHEHFEHEGTDGSTPKDRVLRAGYRPSLTGENIAFGAESADEVVTGWLASAGHCENIMDPRFAELGVAMASADRNGRRTYWSLVLAAPRGG